MNIPEIEHKLTCAAWKYDERQRASSPYFNPHALGIYLERIEAVVADIRHGTSPRSAILKGFNDRLCDVMLRAIGEKPASNEEARNAPLVY